MDAAIVIKDDYMIAASTGNPTPPKQASLRRIISLKEYPDWNLYVKPEEANNAIHVVGPQLDEVITLLNQQDLPAKRNSRDDAPKDLFDHIDMIVFGYLKEKHYQKFKASDQWTKYINFMHLSEQKVTEDDFTLFRVLGRGGFGLVNGCKKCTTGKHRILFCCL